MHQSPSLEHAKAYFDTQLSRPRAPVIGANAPQEGPFVTISRECGTGATGFARALAAHLDAGRQVGEVAWTIFDQDIVEEVLKDQHLSPRLARFLPEDRMPEITGSVGEIVGLHPNLWSLVQRTNALMCALARQGHVILIGRGGNFATRSVGGGLHLRLIASERHRIEHIARARTLSFDEARAKVRRTDAARTHYVRSVFEADVSDPRMYHLVCNVELTPVDLATRMFASVVSTRAGR